MFADFEIVIPTLLAQAEGGPQGLPIWVPFMIVGLLYYFMLFRPEKAQRETHQGLLNNLKKNDQVVTAGGIRGVVVNPQPGESEVVLRIDEGSNTRIHIQRSSISRVITAEDKATADA